MFLLTEETNVQASMSYLNKEGIVLGTEFERFSGRHVQTKCLNNTFDFWLSMLMQHKVKEKMFIKPSDPSVI